METTISKKSTQTLDKSTSSSTTHDCGSQNHRKKSGKNGKGESKSCQHHHHVKHPIDLLSVSTAEKLGAFVSIFASLALAIVTGVAFATIFPGWGLPMAILIGVSGLFTEGAVYWEGSSHASVDIFHVGIFNKLNERILRNRLVDEILGILEGQEQQSIQQIIFLDGINPTAFDDVQKNDLIKMVTLYIKHGPEEATQEEYDKINPDFYLNNDAIAEMVSKITTQLSTAKQHWRASDVETINDANIIKTMVTELRTKQVLLGIAALFAVANGVGFGAITYTHTALALVYLLGVSTTMALPGWALFASLFLAGMAAISYGMVMYHMLFSAIADNFIGQIRAFFHKIFKRPSTPKDNFGKAVLHYLKCFFLVIIFVGVIAMSIVVTIATAGAWLKASMTFFQYIGTATQAVAKLLSQILIFAFFIPTAVMFAFKNTWKCIQCFHDAINNRAALWERWKKRRWDKMSTGVKVGFILFGFIPAMGLFLLHAIGGGCVAGEGATSLSAKLMVVLSALLEVGSDAPFVAGLETLDGAGDDHDHSGPLLALGKRLGQAIPNAYNKVKRFYDKVKRFYDKVKRLFGFGKETEPDGLSETRKPSSNFNSLASGDLSRASSESPSLSATAASPPLSTATASQSIM